MVFFFRQIAADRIISFAKTTAVERVVHLHDGKAEVIEVIAAKKSPITKGLLRDQKLPAGVFLGGIVRDGDVLIPHGDTRVLEGDLVVVMALSTQRERAEKLFRRSLF